MVDQTYQIVFRGRIVPDTAVETVKANLAKLFKTDETQIARLLTGRDVVLKKALSQEEGRRYQALLAKAGAQCDLEPAPSAPPPPPMTKQNPPSVAQESADGASAAKQPPGKGGAVRRAPQSGQQPAAMEAKVKGMRPADLQQTLGAIRDKVQNMDAEEAGRQVSSLIGVVTARVKGDMRRGGPAGLKKNKALWGLGAALLAVTLALVVTFSGSPQPMPIERRVFDKFAQQYYREIHQSDLSSVSASVLIQRAQEVLDDMGFDFNRTLLLWLLNKDQVESQGGAGIYRSILVEPVAVALAAGLSGIDTLVAPDTRQVFETVATLPPGVDLKAIQMVKACPSNDGLLRQDDLLQVLKANKVPIETSPDLAIADAFFGLEQAGFVKIQRRWEDDVQFADLEMRDRDAMNAAEAKLRHLDDLKKQFRET